MYKKNLVLNDLKWSICHKPNQIQLYGFKYSYQIKIILWFTNK